MEKFIDTHTLEIASGDGAAGCVSFRREKYIPFGGPAGGDGGCGGNIIFTADKSISSLAHLYTHRLISAENGQPGRGRGCFGKNGSDKHIKVPVGTLIKDLNGLIIHDFTRDEETFIMLKGGKGGKGNMHFATSVKQSPRYAQKGLPGTRVTIQLEIKLIADIGLVGLPNAGKSTLISTLTNARPKIADYPFTTLKAGLGIFRIDETNSLIIADIPGIIEGAHKGAGLGLEFLRHIERTKYIFYVIDSSSVNPFESFKILKNEIKMYSEVLSQRSYGIGLSKIDIIGNDNNFLPIRDTFPEEIRSSLIFFSAVTHKGLDDLKRHVCGFFYP